MKNRNIPVSTVRSKVSRWKLSHTNHVWAIPHVWENHSEATLQEPIILEQMDQEITHKQYIVYMYQQT